MSASLIGHSGSSAFRLSTATASMSLTGSCFSSELAPGPFHHGVRRRGGTIFETALPSDERQVQADMRTHLIHRPARDIIPPLGGARVSSYRCDPRRFSCCCGLLTVVYRLFHTSTVPILTTWQHWFGSDITGVVTVAPVVIGIASAVRQPPPRSELIEGTAALVALAVMTGIIFSLPQEVWETVMPVAWLFPILLWLAARCRPIFAAAGAFMVSLTVVSTTIFGIGHFGKIGLPIGERILQAQTAILVVAIFALVLAALFAERRANEARLAHANMMLERERENKLVSAQAIIAAIAHDIRQPLVAITTNAGAALRWLGRTPPDQDEARAALDQIKNEGLRAGEMFDGIRALFGKVDQERQPVAVNDIILSVIHSLEGRLNDHGVVVHRELAAELPLIAGHSGQLREVIFNLVNNALEAMRSTTNRNRVLRVRTQLRDRDTIAVAIQDTGPGIDPYKLAGIFAAFVTTKMYGTGLGLAICRMIVERHGGQLTASSDGKSGALFQFILPIKSAVGCSTASL